MGNANHPRPQAAYRLPLSAGRLEDLDGSGSSSEVEHSLIFIMGANPEPVESITLKQRQRSNPARDSHGPDFTDFLEEVYG